MQGCVADAFTCRLATAHAFPAGVEGGTVRINTLQVVLPDTPFGGVRDSGIGRQGGAEGIAPHLIRKFACLDCRGMAA